MTCLHAVQVNLIGRTPTQYPDRDMWPIIYAVAPLSATKHLSPQLAKRGSFSFQSVDFFLYCCCQRRDGRVPSKFTEHVLDMQFGLGRHLSTSPFAVEFGDELPGCCHPSSIGQFAPGFDPARFVTPPPSTPWLP